MVWRKFYRTIYHAVEHPGKGLGWNNGIERPKLERAGYTPALYTPNINCPSAWSKRVGGLIFVRIIKWVET